MGKTCPLCGASLTDAARSCPTDGFPVGPAGADSEADFVAAEASTGSMQAAYVAYERVLPIPAPPEEEEWS